MQLAALYKHIQSELEKSGAVTADQEARIIIKTHTGFEWADIIAKPEGAIPANALENIEADTQRRLAGEPVSRIYGSREFWGLEFKLSPETLQILEVYCAGVNEVFREKGRGLSP